MQKSKLMPTIVLSAICIVTVALLALVNSFTEPRIKANQDKLLQESLLEVMPNGGEFKKWELDGLPSEINDVYKSSNGGYIFQMSVVGFKSGLVILCGIDENGMITGSKCLQSSETNGKEHILGEKYIGKNQTDYTTVEIISNSTKTCEGYRDAISAAFEAFDILTGGIN